MIEAARLAFEASPGDLIAWDINDIVLRGDRVRFEICGWTGQTTFDELRSVEYEVVPGEGGTAGQELSATLVSNETVAGECLNQELLASAFAAANAYDEYWDAVKGRPFDVRRDRSRSRDQPSLPA